MALKIFTVLALCLATTAPGRAATVVDMQLIRAAFFSDACRQAALPLEEQSLVDLLVRERAERKHVLGPALGADARDACPSTCMHVYTAAGNATPPVRVKTETIRGR